MSTTSASEGCYRNPFIRMDKHENVSKLNEEIIRKAESACTPELEVLPDCDEKCRLRDKAYVRYSQELDLMQASQKAQSKVVSSAQLVDKILEFKKLRAGTHKAHEQWRATFCAPKGTRWLGGGSATVYHTLSDNGDGTCSYWVKEEIRYNPGISGKPGKVPPGLWEKVLRAEAEKLKHRCEAPYSGNLEGSEPVNEKQKGPPGGC